MPRGVQKGESGACPGQLRLLGEDGDAPLPLQLRDKFDGGCLDFSAGLAPLQEDLASCDEALMDRYLEGGAVTAADAAALIRLP